MDRNLNFLVVEDDPVDSKNVCRLLHTLPNVDHTDTACDLKEAKGHVLHNSYDAVILDLGLPDSQGLDSVLDLQATAPDLPIVVLTGNGNEETAVRSVDLGAEDCLSKDTLTCDALIRALRFAIERHRHKHAIYESMDHLKVSLDGALQAAATDPLTGLPNRRGLAEYLGHLAPTGPPPLIIVAVADLDQFKAINDEHGHDVGDEVLREFSKRLLHCLRAGDFAARVGGDEFVIVFDTVNREGAAKLGQRIVEHVAATPVTVRHGERVAFSATLAMVEIQGAGAELEQMLNRAHPLLLRGKQGGRMRLECSWSEPMGPGAATAPGPRPIRHHTRALRSLPGLMPLGYRLVFGEGHPLRPQAGLDGGLRAMTLERLQRAEEWRRFNDPSGRLHLDVEADAIDTELRTQLNRMIPHERRDQTVFYFHSTAQHPSSTQALGELKLLRKAGFQLGLRSVGDGSTVFEHLALLGPEWLRVDPLLTHHLARFQKKQDALRLLVAMLRPLDTRLVAEVGAGSDDLKALAALGFHAFEGPLEPQP